MDYPFCPSCPEFVARPRSRLSLWLPIALIAAVLGAAALASAATPDTRSAAERHGSVLPGRAL